MSTEFPAGDLSGVGRFLPSASGATREDAAGWPGAKALHADATASASVSVSAKNYGARMTDVEVVARARISDGQPVERLVCHPRLPLFACLDSQRPAVSVWTCDAGSLRELGSIGAESAVYGEALGWERARRTPAVAWHPHQPLLMVAFEDTTVQWQPSGPTAPVDLPPTARYNNLAFSPDGHTLWASPSSDGADDAWERSDVLDLTSGAVSVGPQWDTGIAEHPGGGLVTTLSSDQGATLALFARVDVSNAPATMRLLRHALILDADGYEPPVFSSDGRHLAIRGNAYGNSLDVFEFPSLRRVFSTTLGEPNPGYPYPRQWRDQMRAWSRQNLVFGTRRGVLWVGTPTGALVEVDIEALAAREHDIFAGSPVSAVGRAASGELVVAGGSGELVFLSVDAAPTDGADDARAKAAVTAFLDSTSEVSDEADLDSDLILTNGVTTWDAEDLATVDTASEADPTWLQLQAAINNVRGQVE
ncbi:hypothetical protein [Streptomyces sp. NPDC049813]|uniref:hypothetical protein n=1 Tax=Streptomyces sp. NPDC049813 TaxID=3365597 RepID=UPI00379C9440